MECEISDAELGWFSAYHGGAPVDLAGTDSRSLDLQADSAYTTEACQTSRPSIDTLKSIQYFWTLKPERRGKGQGAESDIGKMFVGLEWRRVD